MCRTATRLSLVIPALLSAGVSFADSDRSIALILDASGSMRQRLPEGTTRIDAAKAAVADLVGGLPGEARLGFRVYGHQSPTQKRDCQDTALLVPFGAVSENKAAVLSSMRNIEARGYTPITHVLKLAAEDLMKEEAGSRVVVLVSDGQETCVSDPCAAAKALAAADAKLVVHTIGLGVDAAAKFQLQCIASVARGTYFDANTRVQLASALGEAAKKAPAPVKTEITIRSNAPGRIEVRGADRDSHAVFDAERGERIEVVRPNTGQKVDGINSLWPVVEVPAGIYNVAFGNGLWRGVEVKAGQTTVLEPGVLEINNADSHGHKVLEPETGEVVAELFFGKKRVTLLPSRFSVTFGELIWPDVELKPGGTTTLNPGVIDVRTSRIAEYAVTASDGRVAGKVGTGANRLALPAGNYTLDVDGQKVPIELKEGQQVQINLR